MKREIACTSCELSMLKLMVAAGGGAEMLKAELVASVMPVAVNRSW